MAPDPPLVSVGIPTYNRLDRLRRAVASVLAQDYPNLEVVVSDNASDDGTASWLAELAATDPRVVVHRNPTNVGPTRNFNLVREASRGDLLLWLGDDDALEPGYLSACVSALETDPRAVMATGAVRYDRGREVVAGRRVTCMEDDGPARVLAYYRQVGDNGTFYGVTRRAPAEVAGAMANRMGNDWYLLAALAFQGRILAVDQVAVVRDVGGATRSLRHVARTAGQSRIEAELPQLAIAVLAGRDIAWADPTYASLGPAPRLWLGLRVMLIIGRRFVIPSIPKFLRLQADRIRSRPIR